MRSPGYRFLVVGLLTLLMFIPLFFAGVIVQDRGTYADQTSRDIGREWGGPQTLSGPYLLIPVEGVAYREESRQVTDPDTGEVGRETYQVPYKVRRDPVMLLPEELDATIDTVSEIRARGIFEVPVYTADVALAATFDPDRAPEGLDADERLLWDEAVLRLSLTGNAGLRGDTRIDGPNGALDLKPFSGDVQGGIEGRVGALDGSTLFGATFILNGSNEIAVVPVGRATTVRMAGDWADPAFRGGFLPDAREVTETGYSASWSVPHLARALPQVSRGISVEGDGYAFGTAFIQVNDFYQKAWRAARYGILFIALTFLTVLLIDRKDRPAHPVHYILIGVAQSIFVLLMVAYAEQIGFTAAYVGAAGATISLLTLFGWIGLKLGARTWVLGLLLVVLYAVLYLILQSTDLALLAGATLAFAALTLTIVLTRNEDWYGEGGPGHGFVRRPKAQVPPPPPQA